MDDSPTDQVPRVFVNADLSGARFDNCLLNAAGRAVLGEEHPYHPLGVPHAEYALDGYDVTVFAPGTPPYADVLEARADRVARVRDFLAGVTAEDLTGQRPHVWAPDRTVSVLHCLQTILGEEWEHLRFATRHLEAVGADPAP